jgi:anti-anti-sigma factor
MLLSPGREARVTFEIMSGPDGEVRLIGEFDLASVDTFEAAVAPCAAGRREVIFDLSDLEFLDSSGIRAIVEFALARPDKGVVLKGARPNVRKVIELTGIEGRSGIRTEG